MQTYCNEEGGYYLNPPNKFVSAGPNRAGMLVITPSQLTWEAGFRIDSFGKTESQLQKTPFNDIFHLPMEEMKNEWLIKFIRVSD